MKKKILSLLLALCLVMALVPMTAFAEGTSVDACFSYDDFSDLNLCPINNRQGVLSHSITRRSGRIAK